MHAERLNSVMLAFSVAILGSTQAAIAEDSIKISAGDQAVIDKFGTCKTVNNGGANPINIPLRGPAEWSSGSGSFLSNIASMDKVQVSDCVVAGTLGALSYQKWSDEGGIPGHRYPVKNTVFYTKPGYSAPHSHGYPNHHCVLKNGTQPHFHGGAWPFPSTHQPSSAEALAAAEPLISEYKAPDDWCQISFFREGYDPFATDTIWYKVNAIIFSN